MPNQKKISPDQQQELLKMLQDRFEKNMDRHKDMKWEQVQSKLEKVAPQKLWSLLQMEETGGEPDVVSLDGKKSELVFCDCSLQSPKGRRSLCFDGKALASRKEHKPKNSAQELAAEMGIEMLSEDQYRQLQEPGEFDTTTSSWVETPADIRKLGGALFCDRRYDTVFVYHNGAESYYAVRGFRGLLKV